MDQRTGNIILESTAPLRLGAVMDWMAARAVAEHENNLPDIIPMSSGSMDVRGRAFIPEKGAPIRLTDREVDTIRALFLAKDRTMDKAELLDQVWGYAVGAETHTIETHIYRLRQKIERNPSVPENIMTTENGYKLS